MLTVGVAWTLDVGVGREDVVALLRNEEFDGRYRRVH